MLQLFCDPNHCLSYPEEEQYVSLHYGELSQVIQDCQKLLLFKTLEVLAHDCSGVAVRFELIAVAYWQYRRLSEVERSVAFLALVVQKCAK